MSEERESEDVLLLERLKDLLESTREPPCEIMNVEEAAEFLGFSPYTLREKARRKEIPGRKIGREWRFSKRQLLEWIEEGCARQPAGEAPVSGPAQRGNGKSRQRVKRLV